MQLANIINKMGGFLDMENTEKILNRLDLDEKIALLTGGGALTTTGNEKYDIPTLNLSDGPHGVRRLLNHIRYPQECNIKGGDVCLPTASAIGASWSREVAYKAGVAIGRDCKQEEIDVLLAPAVNMKRLPNCGRNFEYYSEDPHLSGILGAEFINGVQSEGIGTSLKHFAANNQEINRGTINSEIDERTLREYYLKVFEVTLEHCNPTSVMCAYNKLNGIWCSENKYLLTELLKDEWNYEGLVISDWGAVHDISKCLKAGLDLEMPMNVNIVEQIKIGIEKGIITEKDVDRAASAVLKFIERIIAMRNRGSNKSEYNREEQHEIAYDTACETITLLKNDKGILPLSDDSDKRIAVLGRCAEDVLFMGGGSSKVTVEKESVDIPLEWIRKKSKSTQIDYFPIFKDGFMDEYVLHTIDRISADYDYVILFIGDNYGSDCETESFDRDNIKLPGYVSAVVEKALAKFENLVLVLQNGAAIIPYRWDKADTVIEMWYSGEAAGRALADILFGKVNPSAKLSETFMKTERLGLDYPGDGVKVEYKEKLDVGYMYYDKHTDEIWFPFGHGLSYTTYEYSNLCLNKTKITDEDFEIEVTCNIKNTGDMDGKEVVQLYIAPLDSVVARPIKELKAFDKVVVKSGECKQVRLKLTSKDFAYYNTCLHGWHVESGCYNIMIGASSRDIRLEQSVSVKYDNDYTKHSFDKSMIL